MQHVTYMRVLTRRILFVLLASVVLAFVDDLGVDFCGSRRCGVWKPDLELDLLYGCVTETDTSSDLSPSPARTGKGFCVPVSYDGRQRCDDARQVR